MDNERALVDEIIETLDAEGLKKWIISGGDVNKRWVCGENTLSLLEQIIWEIDTDEPQNFSSICAMLKLLIDHGADVNAYDSSMRSPLFCAVNEGYAPVVELLLEAGAETDLRDSEGMTPLTRAVLDDNHDVLRALLSYSSVEVINKWGSFWAATPLGIAFAHLQMPMIELLLKHGADPYKPDVDVGTTICHIPESASETEKQLIDTLLAKYNWR